MHTILKRGSKNYGNGRHQLPVRSLSKGHHRTSYKEGISWMVISWNEQLWSTQRQGGLLNLGEAQELTGDIIPAEALSNTDHSIITFTLPGEGKVPKLCTVTLNIGGGGGGRYKKLSLTEGDLPPADHDTKELPWHRQWELLPPNRNILQWVLMRQLWGAV